jgi:hypothetical protein
MFSTKKQLIKRTGKNGITRYPFLKLLVTEYKTTKSKGKIRFYKYGYFSLTYITLINCSFHFELDAKEQVMANLANFAYDPINYGYMRQLQIIDLFLHALSENNPKLIRFAIGGICNLSLGKLY